MNYLKKKIKGHKKGHDDDDDFDFEPAGATPASGDDQTPKQPGLEKDSEEWKFFQQLTQRVHDTVQQTQTNLSKLKDSSAVEEISKPDYDFIDDPAITKVVPVKSASWVDFDENIKKEGNLIPADLPPSATVKAGEEVKGPPPRPPPPKGAKKQASKDEDKDREEGKPKEAFNLLDEFGFLSEPQPSVISAAVNGLLIFDENELDDELEDDKDDPFDTSFVNETVSGKLSRTSTPQSKTPTSQVKTPTDFLSDLVLVPTAYGGEKSDPFVVKDDDDPFVVKDDDDPFVVKDIADPFVVKENDDPFVVKDIDDPFAVKEDDDPFVVRDTNDPFIVRSPFDAPATTKDNFNLILEPLESGNNPSLVAPQNVLGLEDDLDIEDSGPDPFDTSFVNSISDTPVASTANNTTTTTPVKATDQPLSLFAETSRKSSVDNLFDAEPLPASRPKAFEESFGEKRKPEEEAEDMSNPFLTDSDVSPSIPPKFPSGRRRSTNPFEDDILEQAGDLLASSFAETALAASNLTAEITNFATENAKLFDQLESKTSGASDFASLVRDDGDGPSSSLPFGSPPSTTHPSQASSMMAGNIFDVFGGQADDPSPSVQPSDSFHRKLSGDNQFSKMDSDPFGFSESLSSSAPVAATAAAVEPPKRDFHTSDLFGFGTEESTPSLTTSTCQAKVDDLWLTDETPANKTETEEEAQETFSLPPTSAASRAESAVSQVISSLEKIASFAADDLDDMPPPSNLMGGDFNLPIAEVDEPSSIGEYPSLSPPEKVDEHPVGDLFDSFGMGSHYKSIDETQDSEMVNPFADTSEKESEKKVPTEDFMTPVTKKDSILTSTLDSSKFEEAFGHTKVDKPFVVPKFDSSKFGQTFETSKFDQTFETSKFDQTFETSKFDQAFETSKFDQAFVKSNFDQTFETSKFDQAFETSKFNQAFDSLDKNAASTTSAKDPFDLLGGDDSSGAPHTKTDTSDPFGFEPVKDSVPITDTAAFEAFAAKFEQAIEKFDNGAQPESLSTGDDFDPFGPPSAVSSVGGDTGKSSGFDVVDMFDPFLSMTNPPENTPIKMPEPVSETKTRKMPGKQPSRDSFDDDDDVDFTVVIRPKMIDKTDAAKISLEPPPLLPPPPKSPMKDPREQSATPASRFNPFNKDFGFSLDVGKEEPSVNLLASPLNETELPPALGEAGVKKSGDTPESPRTPLFDEDTSQPLEDFPPKLDVEIWELMLRQPSKKKITGNRYWKKVYVKLSENSILQLFNKKEDNDPFQELPLQACYSLSEVGAQQYDAYGKIFTVKFNYTFYRERMGVRPGQISKVMHGQITSVGQIAKLGLPLEHAPQVSQLLKLGSQTYNDVKTFVQIMEDTLFRLPVHRDRALTYKTEEIQIAVHDELYVEQRRDGHVEKQNARVRLFFLAFISGMPNVEVGLNDLLREGKEVVGRYDIIPVVTEEWIRLENWEFHSCVVQEEFENTRIVKLHPPDACLFELMRFRIRPPKNRELPLQVKCSMRITSMRVEMRADILVPGYHSRKHGQVPCEDIQIRFPLPECWIYLFRVEKHFRYGSLKSAARKPGKIKGLERIMGAAQTLDTSLIEVSTGQAKYEHSFKSVVWRIPRLPKEGQGAYTTQLFLLRLDLTSFDQIPETFERYIFVQFTMPATTVSHTTVRSVSVTNENPPEKYVKYAARHEYRIEIDMSQGGEENEYTSAVTSAMNAANAQSPSIGGDSPKIGSSHDEEDEDDSD